MAELTVQEIVAAAKKEIIEFDVIKVDQIIKGEDIHLIDVREPEEYYQGHISGAINVPRGVLEFRADPGYPGAMPILYEKAAPLIIYCRSGARSALAAHTLGLLGYTSVVSMAGGFMAWEDAGLAVES